MGTLKARVHIYLKKVWDDKGWHAYRYVYIYIIHHSDLNPMQNKVYHMYVAYTKKYCAVLYVSYFVNGTIKYNTCCCTAA